jgi:ureidoglycolate lyase
MGEASAYQTMIFVAGTSSGAARNISSEAGDVILWHATGVGLGMKPEPKFLKAGDVVTLGIDGLGEQRQKVVKFKM